MSTSQPVQNYSITLKYYSKSSHKGAKKKNKNKNPLIKMAGT